MLHVKIFILVNEICFNIQKVQQQNSPCFTIALISFDKININRFGTFIFSIIMINVFSIEIRSERK